MFTTRAKEMFKLAEDAARGFGHPCVGSQHLLLGLFFLGQAVSFNLLRSLGFIHDSLLDWLNEVGSAAEPTETVDIFICGASAAAALRRARRGANALRHSNVSNEHILMSLLSEKAGGASQVFAAHGVDTVSARRTLIRECSWAIPKRNK
jgi:ATP-dependent Clp protease ATP-binding subunit ClpC